MTIFTFMKTNLKVHVRESGLGGVKDRVWYGMKKTKISIDPSSV